MDDRIIPISHGNIKDMSGLTFGRLTVVGYVGRPAIGKGACWLCHCACGGETITRSTALSSGSTKSCGCLQIEAATKHGDSFSTEYRAWDAMKQRCHNPSNKYFSYYGGRGIKVCDRWRQSYSAFLEDMGRRPDGLNSIDRIDNNGDYEPGNCRWTTQTVQIRNRRNAVRFELDGHLFSQAELAEKFGIPFGTLRSRLARGWSVERAVRA